MIEMLLDPGKIVIADLILSGDNALIIGMAAGLRILFAVLAPAFWT